MPVYHFEIVDGVRLDDPCRTRLPDRTGCQG